MKIAVYIDGDNTNAKIAESALVELRDLGTIVDISIHANFVSSPGWKHFAAKHGADCRQHFPLNGSGKNGSDIALTVDVLDSAMNEDVDTIALLSSDVDFTALAWRCKRANKRFIGVGNGTTPEVYQEACDQFILMNPLTPALQIRRRINEVIRKAAGEDRWALMSEVGINLPIEIRSSLEGASLSKALVQKGFVVDFTHPARVRAN